MKRLEKIRGVTVRFNANQKELLTFRTGGSVAAVVQASNTDSLRQVLRICVEQNVQHYILGKGANTLPTPSYAGAVIKYTADDVWIEGNILYACGGASGGKVAHAAQMHGLGGAEMLGVIPCTMGGAVCCNAGCYGSSVQDVYEYALATNGNDTRIFTKQQADFSYRRSAFMSNGYVVTLVALKLHRQDEATVRRTLQSYRQAKSSSQPLNYPSAGSVFVRCGEVIPARLIDQAGLKGKTVGGAQVSVKHANFIVNLGNATAEDVKSLIDYVTREIYNKYSVTLTREPKYLGEK